MPSPSTTPADHLPDMSAPVSHRSLSAGADVYRDEWGIPHIRSDNLYDLFFAQGFATAQDRLWQMDYDRLRCLGRAGEYVGESAKTQDILMRRRHFERVSRADYEICSADSKTALDAYADGVNAFIDGDDPLPFEYSLLECEPEQWEPWHCILVYKVRNSAEGGFQSKLWHAKLARRIGTEETNKLASGYLKGMYLTVPPGVEYDGEARNVIDELHTVVNACEPLREIDLGSNGWAISGELTNTGLPMVGGDSHRVLEMPNVYYQTHLTHPDFDAIGHSIPGMPLVMHFAHNRHVAWGMTHGGCDTQDLFVEQLRGVDGGVQYLFKGEWRQAEVRVEAFTFLGSEEGSDVVTETAESITTHHGPMITGGPDTGWGVSLADPGSNDATPWVDAALDTMKSRNADEFEAALAGWTDRVNNYPYADVYGQFGYALKGRVPMRTFANAFGPVPGWTGEHEWQGFIPPHQMPRVRNPETGWVVTCNQRVVGDDYPFWLAASFGPDYRARRIISHIQGHIEAGREISVADMREFHADAVSITGLQFREWLKGLPELDAVYLESREWIEHWNYIAGLVEVWDGRMDRESEVAWIYATFSDFLAIEVMSRLYDIDRKLLTDHPDLSAYDHYRRCIRPPVMTVLEDWHAEAHLAYSGDIRVWAIEALSPTAEVVRGARFPSETSAPEDPGAATSSDKPECLPRRAQWGDFHATRQTHPLSRVDRLPGTSAELDAPTVSTDGFEDVPFATAPAPGPATHKSNSGPVNRYLHDPSDWSNSRWIVPLGASGNSASPHFSDQQQLWADVEYVRQLYDWDEIEQSAETVQRFSPSE